MTRPYYAPTSNYGEGIQSAYDAGLSYFPDVGSGLRASPLGNIATDLAAAGGTALGGPAGGVAAGAASSVIQRWFGGSAVDQQRQERVNYVAQYAVNGNVAAMQLILAAPSNVSGNERTMWENAYTLIKQANPDVVRDAEALGPMWFVNSGDTATNYPVMRNFITTWAGQHPFTAAVGAAASAIGQIFTQTPPVNAPGSTPYYGVGQPGVVPTIAPKASPVLLYAGLAVAAYVVLSARRRS